MTAYTGEDWGLYPEPVPRERYDVADYDDAPYDVRGTPVGVGAWLGPWPVGAQYDPELLADGDRRNVADKYRYWRTDAVKADLDLARHPFHVAIENLGHDLNIGTVVRTANAFNAAGVHIVGRTRWNRRGAMVTDRYMDVRHHASVGQLLSWAADAGLPVIGVDNLPGAVPLSTFEVPRACVLLFGQEGPGLSDDARAALAAVVSIPQFGSTRSINVGVAAGIAMFEWVRRWADAGSEVSAPAGPPA